IILPVTPPVVLAATSNRSETPICCAAVGLVGKESDLFRFTVKHSLIFTCMVGVITTLQAYVLTWMIP
ncbi:L-lactate permease, partial [Escherichia coli]